MTKTLHTNPSQQPIATENIGLPKSGFVDKRAVAEFLGFSTRYVEILMKKKGLPYMAFGLRRCRFQLDEVALWAKRTMGNNYLPPFSQN